MKENILDPWIRDTSERANQGDFDPDFVVKAWEYSITEINSAWGRNLFSEIVCWKNYIICEWVVTPGITTRYRECGRTFSGRGWISLFESLSPNV